MRLRWALFFIAVDQEALGDDVADGHARVQRGVGILEDDLHLAAQGLEFGGAQVEDILPVEEDRACRGRDQAQDGAGDGGLAAAGLAHQAEGLPLAHGEAHVVHGLHLGHHLLKDARADREVGLQVLYDQDIFFCNWDGNSHSVTRIIVNC